VASFMNDLICAVCDIRYIPDLKRGVLHVRSVKRCARVTCRRPMRTGLLGS